MNIEEQKEKLNQLEIKQANLHLEYLKKRRSQFDFADTSQWIALNRKEEDLLLLGDAFTRWSSALKDGDTRKDELILLLQSVWRLQAYCTNLETIIQSAVMEYVTKEKRNSELLSEKRRLELEIEKLKKNHQKEKQSLEEEIKFISKNG